MLMVLSSVRGGVGTSVVSAAIAVLAARDQSRPTYLVDLAGDQTDIFGLAQADIGLDDWTTRADRRLTDLAVDIDPQLRLVPSRTALDSTESLDGLVTALEQRRHDTHVVIDAGRLDLSDPFRELRPTHLLVIRPCYLALRATVSSSRTWDGLVVVRPPDRVLTTRDVVNVTGLPAIAEVDMSADVARAVDAGVFGSRLPGGLERSLRPAIERRLIET